MTGLLDGGLQGVFGAAFGGIYLDATLHRKGLVFASDGGVSSPGDSDEPVKAHFASVTEAMRQAEGYSERDVALLILQSGVSAAPTTDDAITLSGQRWAIAGPITEDPARTHWLVRGRRA